MVPYRVMAVFLGLFAGLLALEAQDSLLLQRISIAETQCSLDEALKIIEQKTGLSFSYNSGLIDKRKQISFYAEKEKLIDLLKRLLDDPSLNYSIIGRHLVIYRTFRTQTVNPENGMDSVYYFVISGKVMDSDTRQPLSFSTVYLIGKTVGTISNEEGEFKLKLSSAEFYETLSISCIGYKNFSAPVSSLINTDRNYLLETDFVSIQEVIIRKLSPVFLIENANKRRDENYSLDPSVLTLFYRETIKRSSRYTMVSEAILENFKPGYGSVAADRVKILKGRKNEDFIQDDSVMLKLKAGLNTMLLLDVIKNTPDFLTGQYLNDYSYRMSDIVVEDGRDNYAIEFIPKTGSEAIYSGKIIIDINDMAFKWIEFQVDPLKLDMATDWFILKKPGNLDVKMLKANYRIAFRKTNGIYYMHLIQCETGFKIKKRRQFSGVSYNTKLETVVIGIDTINISKFPLRESARPLDFFTNQVGAYDESFWGEYNFISPDESLENALSKIKKAASLNKIRNDQ